ncbi:MAG TPA: hypothetical protein VGC30_16055 [Dokdonella sp.]
MRLVLAATFALVAARTAAAAGVHYLDLVNTAHDDVVSFAVAAAGEAEFRDARLGDAPLRGGGDSTTIRIDGPGCRRDFRTVFASGRVLVQKDFDVCRYRSDHLGRYLRAPSASPGALSAR